MYISNLSIHGFKSFAKKDTIKFGEGITAIVGPNGCGKTNIVDAIRWVLGEQKYSILRSSKMEDVIFNGADSLKPLSVCEVSLTVHNNKGKLPVEYIDIEIGRRVFRSGDSEYFINKTPCRLKDIQNLFIDSGMGADAYSVIELKMIEQILSETNDDRKRMFEEAAGINKYKQQRKSTLRKFEAVRMDLERIQDIIAEVETKVNALGLQLKRFQRHEKLTDELKQRELALAFLKIKDYEELVSPLQKKIQDFKYLRDSTATKSSIHEEELDQLKFEYKKQQEELDNLQSEIEGVEAKRDELQRHVLVSTEQRRAAESTKERLSRERINNENRLKQLQAQIRDYEDEAALLMPKINENIEKYKSEKSTFDKLDIEYKKAQENVDELQDKRWNEQRRLSDEESLFNRTKDMLKDKKAQLESLLSKQDTVTIEQSSLINEINDKKASLQSLKNNIDLSRNRCSQANDELKSLELQEQEYIRKHHSLEAKLEGLDSQARFYENLVESKEGYAGGVKYVLDHPKEFPGIDGVLSEWIDVDETYNSVIESVMGSKVGCLVSSDRESALETLKKLKEGQRGNASILPLKEINSLPKNKAETPENKLIIARALDVIRIPEKYSSIIQLILGKVLIVKDLSKALTDVELAGWNLVDMKGTYAGSDYVVKHQTRGKGLVGRKKQLEKLYNSINVNNNALSNLENEIKANSNQLESARTCAQETSDELNRLNTQLQTVENDTLLLTGRYEQAQKLLKSINEETDEVNAGTSTLEKVIIQLIPSAEKGKIILEKLESELTRANDLLLEIRRRRDELHQHVQDIRIDVLNLENQRENLLFQKRTAEESCNEFIKRQTAIDEDIFQLDRKRNQLKLDIDHGEKELQKTIAVVQKNRSVLDLKKETTKETFSEIELIQRKIHDEQKNRERLLEELNLAELNISSYNQEINLIEERIKDRYQSSIPKQLQVKDRTHELEDRIEKIIRSIEKIGPINMAVKDEYDAESERHHLLVEQKKDLEESEENLRETIQNIDREARKMFIETFEQIKMNFEKLFTMFFEGGTGTLSLVGDPDPLESDIAISAQPPGKKNSALRLLSAGEKSLTAIALLFSIYQHKPSPYCILDEVDAPLDDVNIHKFTKVLEAFSDETQFIVVTHNKLTMEAAKYLYGVTMEQKGVSKLVSVKFNA